MKKFIGVVLMMPARIIGIVLSIALLFTILVPLAIVCLAGFLVVVIVDKFLS